MGWLSWTEAAQVWGARGFCAPQLHLLTHFRVSNDNGVPTIGFMNCGMSRTGGLQNAPTLRGECFNG